jgi:hypothetical protein
MNQQVKDDRNYAERNLWKLLIPSLLLTAFFFWLDSDPPSGYTIVDQIVDTILAGILWTFIFFWLICGISYPFRKKQ